jgi:hemolysin III
MGWLIVIAFDPLTESLTHEMLALLVLGGLSYTFGIICFALEARLAPRRIFWMHEIFHVFVILGSTFHSIVMFLLLRP